MNAEIYYFSGTGNSFFAARKTAGKLGAKLISIPSVIDKPTIHTDAYTVVVVFPSYLAHLHGIPLMVENFIKKLSDIQDKQLFAVCTCGGYESVNALPTLKIFRRLVKSLGGKVSAEFSIRLPMNNLDYDHIPVPISKDHEAMFLKSESKMEYISARIRSKKGSGFKFAKSLFNSLMSPFYRMMRGVVLKDLRIKAKEPPDSNLSFRELIPLTDKSIQVNENCIGCGTCARVCPAGNIKIVDEKPIFQHRCEMCFACDEWCPQEAIRHWGREEGVKYHHPHVSLSDMVQMK